MTREDAIEHLKEWKDVISSGYRKAVIDMAIKALSAEAAPQSEQYKRGFEDAKRAFLIEYARESKSMRKRNAQLETMLNAQNAISAEARPTGEWIEVEVFPEVYDIEGVKTWGSKMQCDQCGFRHTAIEGHMAQYNFCPNCGADMRGKKHD